MMALVLADIVKEQELVHIEKCKAAMVSVKCMEWYSVGVKV